MRPAIGGIRPHHVEAHPGGGLEEQHDDHPAEPEGGDFIKAPPPGGRIAGRIAIRPYRIDGEGPGAASSAPTESEGGAGALADPEAVDIEHRVKGE